MRIGIGTGITRLRPAPSAGGGGGGGAVTFNPSDKSTNITLSSGNLVATWTDAGGNPFGVRGTTAIGTGKYYFEALIGDTAAAFRGLGLIKSTTTISPNPGANLYNSADAVTVMSYYGQINLAGGYVANAGNSSSKSSPHVFRMAVDGNAKKIWFAMEGDATWGATTWRGASGSTGDPAAGTNGIDFSALTGTLFPFVFGATNGQVFTARFKSTDWAYSAPSGFSELT